MVTRDTKKEVFEKIYMLCEKPPACPFSHCHAWVGEEGQVGDLLRGLLALLGPADHHSHDDGDFCDDVSIHRPDRLTTMNVSSSSLLYLSDICTVGEKSLVCEN